jgi:hypothetical protein
MNFKHLIFVLTLSVFGSFYTNKIKKIHPKTYEMPASHKKVVEVYNSLRTNSFTLPTMESFAKALKGFYILKEKGLIAKNYLTIIDYSLSSKVKRMWIIDMTENKIMMNSLVAHGKKSGVDYANRFSNTNESNKSSLGFFATGEAYNGKHGLSLKLDGLDNGINNNVRQRAIVIHGADYVSDNFIENHNRLGRSQGCPAVPVELSKKIIQIIKDKSCLFIYHSSKIISTT